MTKDVAEKKSGEISQFDSTIFEQDQGLGLENLGQDDLALPFLKVLSRQDPTLDDLDDAKAGDIYNTVTGDIFKGKEGCRVVPCVYQRRYIEWAPRGTGSGAPINIFTPDEKRPDTERSSEDNREYVVGGNGSYLEETHQHFVMILKEDGTQQTALDHHEVYSDEKVQKVELYDPITRHERCKRGVYSAAILAHLPLKDCFGREQQGLLAWMGDLVGRSY